MNKEQKIKDLKDCRSCMWAGNYHCTRPMAATEGAYLDSMEWQGCEDWEPRKV